MNIGVIGTGYVGLVTGTCFAEMGNEVICIDNDIEKVKALNNNIVPIYEPGLEELVKRNKENGRLSFSGDVKEGIEKSFLIFIAVGTPTNEDGSADLKYVTDVAHSIGKFINGYKIIVDKSTVPVGTSELLRSTIIEEQKANGKMFEFDIISNPEFLKEGNAIEDFMKPDRIIIGADTKRSAEIMKAIYSPFTKNIHPIIVMDIKSAEITKYAANCMLAARISFMNEISLLCEKTGADISNVRLGIGTDSRIGMPFLYAGLGYGGSCFPKDVKALIKSFSEINEESSLLKAIVLINSRQRRIFIDKIFRHFNNDLKDKTVSIWGLSFKPNTDDMREAPSITIINELLSKGVIVQIYDPQAMNEARNIFGEGNGKIIYCNNQYDALINSNALLLLTEWNCFKEPDFEKMKSLLKDGVIFDGRNLYEIEIMSSHGFKYYCMGRKKDE